MKWLLLRDNDLSELCLVELRDNGDGVDIWRTMFPIDGDTYNVIAYIRDNQIKVLAEFDELPKELLI